MSVLTLAEAKGFLNITVTTDDAKLQDFIDAAEAAIARRVGPLTATAVTYRARGGQLTLMVPTTPCISLTSVTPVGGSAMTLTDLWLSPNGVIESLTGSTLFWWRFYDIIYQAGRATVPDDLLHAIKDTVKHLWETQRKSAPGSSGQAAIAGAAYAFTFRVREMWEPHIQYGFG